MRHPLTITCPRCGAEPGKYCRSPNGHVLHPRDGLNASHRARHKAVGDPPNRRRSDDDIPVVPGPGNGPGRTTALEPWPLIEAPPGQRTAIVFHPEAIADVRTLIERRFGETTKSTVTQFLHDLYDEGYMLVMVVDPT